MSIRTVYKESGHVTLTREWIYGTLIVEATYTFSRFGIKSFIACDCETGYILNMTVYSGLEADISAFQENLGKSGNIVTTLKNDHLGKGHSLYVDNWYTSPLLFNTLHSN